MSALTLLRRQSSSCWPSWRGLPWLLPCPCPPDGPSCQPCEPKTVISHIHAARLHFRSHAVARYSHNCQSCSSTAQSHLWRTIIALVLSGQVRMIQVGQLLLLICSFLCAGVLLSCLPAANARGSLDHSSVPSLDFHDIGLERHLTLYHHLMQPLLCLRSVQTYLGGEEACFWCGEGFTASMSSSTPRSAAM